ncbi:MAG: hypothetical protein F6J93_39315 [Oscillatoria sp. SIO1A7]|nr:hypothetical protein [Oscillatoria sp. SIO1A7]
MTLKIEKLSPEQQSLIPVYRQKWRSIAFSTKPIEPAQAAAAVKAAYAAIGEEEPEVIFAASPYDAEKKTDEITNLGFCSSSQTTSLLEDRLWKGLVSNLWKRLKRKVARELNRQIWNELVSEVRDFQLESLLFGSGWCIQPQDWAGGCSAVDFCLNVLGLKSSRREEELEAWSLARSLLDSCDRIYPYEKIAIVCDRPRQIHFDSQGLLHAFGKLALEFADGYGFYCDRGVPLPEKYGKLHRSQWQAQWLLSETNAELRRVLIQRIGYSRICQELAAVSLDAWREYELLTIEGNLDLEPIHLLKMTCPSTGFIHVLRIPPDIETARKAIQWINWGIDPEDFAIET